MLNVLIEHLDLNWQPVNPMGKMKLILFYHIHSATLGRRFEQNMANAWPGIEMEVFNTVDRLKQRLKRHTDFFENEIYIFLVDSKSRLLELVLLNHLMEDRAVVLILPEESEEFIRLAMHLCPRFITGISEGYKDLHLVLKQMAGK